MVHAFAGALLRIVIVVRLTGDNAGRESRESNDAISEKRMILEHLPPSIIAKSITVSMLGARVGQCLDFLFVHFFFSVFFPRSVYLVRDGELGEVIVRVRRRSCSFFLICFLKPLSRWALPVHSDNGQYVAYGSISLCRSVTCTLGCDGFQYEGNPWVRGEENEPVVTSLLPATRSSIDLPVGVRHLERAIGVDQ
jgi:hypothetical protein